MTLKPRASNDFAALQLLRRRSGALCTIVSIDGSFSRDRGSHLAIGADGEMAGSLSDGCLELELATQAERATLRGEAVVLRYGAGSPFIDFRLPCGAGIEILVDPRPDRRAIDEACTQLDARQIAWIELPSAAGFEGQIRSYIPPVRLILFGAGPELQDLAALSLAFGVRAELHIPGRDVSLYQRPSGIDVDPWTAIVLLFHDHPWEEEILPWALATPAFYIGSMGGKTSRADRIERLQKRGIDDGSIARVRGPAGLIRSARDPATLALSILAEIVAEYEQLRRTGPALAPEKPLRLEDVA